ncbi:hypothetical protein BHE74_00031204 [Ensete ventricosum]|nr:hypothetical protein BHE74_00031204 [Ensete ventricosum]RZR99531.1 hypothetical protein BHM03_00029088 [Ensete ventricosum]
MDRIWAFQVRRREAAATAVRLTEREPPFPSRVFIYAREKKAGAVGGVRFPLRCIGRGGHRGIVVISTGSIHVSRYAIGAIKTREEFLPCRGKFECSAGHHGLG